MPAQKYDKFVHEAKMNMTFQMVHRMKDKLLLDDAAGGDEAILGGYNQVDRRRRGRRRRSLTVQWLISLFLSFIPLSLLSSPLRLLNLHCS